MQVQNKLPTHNCQFVVLWLYNDRPWANTFACRDKEYFSFNETADRFVNQEDLGFFDKNVKDYTVIIKDGYYE